MGKPRCSEKDLSRRHAGANEELRCENWAGGLHLELSPMNRFCRVMNIMQPLYLNMDAKQLVIYRECF
jgi:hypothetical protein